MTQTPTSWTPGTYQAVPEGPTNPSITTPSPVTSPTDSTPPQRNGRKPIGKVARRVIAAVIVLIALVAFWPAQYGGLTGLTVVNGESMQPTYYPGDLVVSLRLPAYEVGDVISYLVPAGQDGAGQRVIHRITKVDMSTGGPIYTTMGDNNFGAPDPWLIGPKDVMGSAVLTLSGFGALIGGMANPLLFALIFAVLVTVVLWSADPRNPNRSRKPTQ